MRKKKQKPVTITTWEWEKPADWVACAECGCEHTPGDQTACTTLRSIGGFSRLTDALLASEDRDRIKSE